MMSELLRVGKLPLAVQGELPPQEQIPQGGLGGFQAYKPIASMMCSAMGTPPTVEVRQLAPSVSFITCQSLSCLPFSP